MNPVKTPERVREVKNIVDALNHKRERLIKAGVGVIPPKITKKRIWTLITKADNPEEAYQRIIGTKDKPGTLRQALPSVANFEGGYELRVNENGETYMPASQQIDEVFNVESNLKRNKNYEVQKQEKREEFEKPEDMDDEEYEGLTDDIAADGGALREEKLPEYGTYDSEKYWDFAINVGNVDFYIDNYMDAWVKYGYFPYTEELTKIMETIKKLNPMRLVEIFNSGDKEADVDFVYELYVALMKSQRRTKGGRRGYATYINGIERIMRYWRKKLEEVQNDFE